MVPLRGRKAKAAGTAKRLLTLAWLWCSCLAAVVCSGCAGYRLGPTAGAIPGSRSIQVNPLRNATPEPRLIEPVTSALRRRLQQDGTFRLSTGNDGDILVTGVILKFDRTEVSFQRNDILTVRDYGLILTAKITAVERLTGKALLSREVTGRTTIRVGSDLASAERQAIPLVADDLARNVTSMLVEGDW